MYELSDWGSPEAPPEFTNREKLVTQLPHSLVRVLRSRARVQGISLNVFIDQPSAGRTKCRVSITDVRTGKDQRTRGGSGSRTGSRSKGTFTRSTSKSGNRRFVFGALRLGSTSIVHLRCELAPQARIRGIFWEERLETDRDESFGAIKGPQGGRGGASN